MRWGIQLHDTAGAEWVEKLEDSETDKWQRAPLKIESCDAARFVAFPNLFGMIIA